MTASERPWVVGQTNLPVGVGAEPEGAGLRVGLGVGTGLGEEPPGTGVGLGVPGMQLQFCLNWASSLA